MGAPPPPGRPGAWAASRPGLLPLRPLGFGTLLGAPFLLLRRNPGATFGSALLLQAVTALISVLVVGGATWFAVGRIASASDADRDEVAAGSIAIIIGSVLVPLVLSVVTSAFLQGLMVQEVARETLGERLRLAALWRAVLPRLLPLVGWTIVAGVAVTLGVVLIGGAVFGLVALGGAVGIAIAVAVGVLGVLGLVVLFAWLGTKLALVPSAIVIEKHGVAAAMGRSWSLTAGHFWRTFGTLVLVGIIIGTVSQIVTAPISLLAGFAPAVIDPTGSMDADTVTPALIGTVIVGNLLVIVVSVVVGAVGSVVQSAVGAVVYLDLRMRKEGLDGRLQRFVEERERGGDPADPYVAPETIAE